MSSSTRSEPEPHVVGEGADYVALRDAARALVPEWCPNGYQGNWWGLTSGGIKSEQPGADQHTLSLFPDNWPSAPVARKTETLAMWRAHAISLLIYCEAVEKAASS